jgi:predicted TIM-barrel fold metal-dependent hydrolase
VVTALQVNPYVRLSSLTCKSIVSLARLTYVSFQPDLQTDMLMPCRSIPWLADHITLADSLPVPRRTLDRNEPPQSLKMPTKISRRAFNTLSAATALAATQALAAETADWIDAHVHVWTPDTDKYPLDPGFTKDAMQPPSFTPEQLFEHCRPAGVSRVVLIQMSFYNFDNRYMLDMIAKHAGVFSGVGIVDHHAADVAANIKELAAHGVRGFRLHSRGDADSWVNDKGMATLWRTARESGLAVCPLINPADIVHVDALCRKFPGTKVVVDHFARVGISGQVVPEELDTLCKLAEHKDVHVKTSAFYALGKKQPPYTDLIPMIRRVVDAFGPDRLMWASDCPYQVQGDHTYQASIALIREHIDFLSPGDKEAILKKTAERVFFTS